MTRGTRDARGGTSEGRESGDASSALLAVWVQPRANRTEVAGRHGDAIKIRLAVLPVDGAANEELIQFLAERLGVARSAVRLVSGHSGRRKRIAVEGLSGPEVQQRLLAPDATRGRE